MLKNMLMWLKQA